MAASNLTAGRREWMTLFGEIISEVSFFYTSLTQKRKIVLQKCIVRREISAASGIVLKKLIVGAIVGAIVPESPCYRSAIKPGAVLLDINGSIVIFETYQSIQRKIDTSRRPTSVRFLQQGVIFDVILWTKEHGLVLCGAMDIAAVESVESRSVAWENGVRCSDILVQICTEKFSSEPILDFSSMSFPQIISMLSTTGSKLMTFVGPRHIFLEENDVRVSDLFLKLIEELNTGDIAGRRFTLQFSSIFQEDTIFNASSVIERCVFKKLLLFKLVHLSSNYVWTFF